MPPSTRPLNQRQWLEGKYELYRTHHAAKTLGRFFPPLYEEYFSVWPLTPTAQDITAARGNIAVATSVVRRIEQHRIYRWMFNHGRSKHGMSGEGSSASLNLTAGPPKKKAAVQAYVKRYWDTKIRQVVIDKWAPTLETDLFDETDIGEDQVPWEELTPMEKNIPLWFRMDIGRKLYEAESDEVKAEIDQLRDQEKEDAITARTSSTTFTTDEERREVMKRFDENFAKLSHSLRNLCSNMARDFGFHTSIIVGGPLVRDDGRLSVFTYESHGTTHKQLTFSEFLGQSYDTEVSQKFVEYLRLCFPKEERQLYTLKSTTSMATTPPVPNEPTAPVLNGPVPRTTGPIRTQRNSTQARMRTGPMTPALKARIMANPPNDASKTRATNGTQVITPLIEAESTAPIEAASIVPIETTSTAPIETASTAPIETASTIPIEAEPIASIEPAHPSQSALIDDPSGVHQPPPGSEDNSSDSLSYTSTLPDVFEVEMDDSAPLATGPWMMIDHFTGEMVVDDEALPPVPPTVPGVSPNSTIPAGEVMGITVLTQTPPPTLLYADQDVRPNWLIRSTNEFLRYVPYYMCLNEIVDLFFAQEAKLGYQIKSTRLALPSTNRPAEVAAFMKYGRDFSRGDNVDAEKFGARVVEWWITIQPTARKAWPPSYEPLSHNFSFDYFKRGGPNGVFLVVLCLSWWASALTVGADHTSFKQVVYDVRWVLEHVADCA